MLLVSLGRFPTLDFNKLQSGQYLTLYVPIPQYGQTQLNNSVANCRR